MQSRRPALVLLPLVLLLFGVLAGCPSEVDDDDSGATPTPEVPATWTMTVTVTLDGEPADGVKVMQGGLPERLLTGTDGTAELTLDLTVEGEVVVIAAHPMARQGAAIIERDELEPAVTIALDTIETEDNPDYIFKDPGEPGRRESTGQCAHCHVTINGEWVESAHRDAARDPQVHDLYAGTAAGLVDVTACEDAGGAWLVGPLPGGGEADRCYLGAGTLGALNDCPDGPCGEATEFGACADCHAPGIDGALGGRDLLEASGHAYDYGVHCDTCHRVESVDLTAPAGVAGALRMLRPSPPGGFGWPDRPLMFGPYDDVPNGVMGAVERDHFTDARLCAGCHELEQQVLVPGGSIDAARWPGGVLPIHTTYGEWLAGPLSPGSPCQTCHMPPNTEVGNAADIDLFDLEPGLVAGWFRAPGAVRKHTFDGPAGGGPLLSTAAAVDLEAALDGGVLTATATVRNVGAGHAIPTGEPLRSLLLVVQARCGDELLAATQGFALSDVGGALAIKEAGEDWSLWPGAAPGMVVRVVSRPGTWHDEPGFGPFGDGTFSAEQKGMPVEQVVGSSSIVSMDGDVATFDGPLPVGDRAMLGEAPDLVPGSAAEALAGSPGHAFARVLGGVDGQRNVPHFLAVDVLSDNRLMPGASWFGTWTFDASCADPETTASLLYRQWPLELARERGWLPTDVLAQQAVR